MARNAHKISLPATQDMAVDRSPAPLRIADDAQGGYDPVGRLRADLDIAFVSGGHGRWSPLGTSMFLLAVCGTFWVLVAMALVNGLR